MAAHPVEPLSLTEKACPAVAEPPNKPSETTFPLTMPSSSGNRKAQLALEPRFSARQHPMHSISCTANIFTALALLLVSVVVVVRKGLGAS